MQFAKVIKDDSSVLMFAKMQVEGHGTGFEKHDWLKIIKGRAADLYGETMTPEQAFSRTIVEDETGRLLYKALKAAPGFEVKPAEGWDKTKAPLIRSKISLVLHMRGCIRWLLTISALTAACPISKRIRTCIRDQNIMLFAKRSSLSI